MNVWTTNPGDNEDLENGRFDLTVCLIGAGMGLPRQRFKSGTKLIREWRGKRHEVTLNDEGYHYMGKTYKIFSPIACEITGTRWSGPAFFGTKKVKAS